MKHKNKKYVYFMSFGMLIDSVTGSEIDIFIKEIATITLFPAGSELDFAIGLIHYIVFSNTDICNDN